MALISAQNLDGYGNQLRLYAEETNISERDNASSIHAWLDLYVVNGGSVKSSSIYVGVAGAYEQSLGYQEYYAGTHTLINGYYTANHNPDGSGTSSVYGYFHGGFGSWDLSGTLTLTKINRYPVLESGTDFTDRTNPVYTITAYNTYPIRAKIEAGGNTQLITRDLTSKESQVYTFELTKQERKTLRDLSLDGETLAVRETVVAMNNGSEVSGSASYKDYTMTITSRPFKLRVNGEFVDAIPYVRVNNEWKEADAYVRVNNEWKEGI